MAVVVGTLNPVRPQSLTELAISLLLVRTAPPSPQQICFTG